MTKEEKESLRKDKLIENLEKQVRLLQISEDNLEHAFNLEKEYVEALKKQLQTSKRETTLAEHAIAIVKTVLAPYAAKAIITNMELDVSELDKCLKQR